MTTSEKPTICCKICGELVEDHIITHIGVEHKMSVQEYTEKFPDAPLVTEEISKRFKEVQANIRRSHPPPPDALTQNLCGIEFPVYPDVPEEACLPLPEHYRFPTVKSGTGRNLYADVMHALIAMRKNRSIYIHGLPGAGKDALIHAYSALCRRPGIIRSIKPGTDIQSWFFSRELGSEGTFWQEGPLLKALRDGYGPNKIPYIVLISDLDRAEPAQAEYLRLILDSIEGRIEGPEGNTYPVLPGTLIVATGNTRGSGDPRGRAVSAQVMDATIIDRFDRCFEFRWMDWDDELIICQNKFPKLYADVPKVFEILGKVTKAIRDSILNEVLYAEFSHRAVCQILEHTQDVLEFTSSEKKRKDADWLFRQGAQTWLDKLPDEESVNQACGAINPHVNGGMMGNGRKQTGPSPDISGWGA